MTTYNYPVFVWESRTLRSDDKIFTLNADGHPDLPHGGACTICVRPDGWGEMRTHNGTPGSVRYSCVPPARLAEGLDDGIRWAKRKFREHAKWTASRRLT